MATKYTGAPGGYDKGKLGKWKNRNPVLYKVIEGEELRQTRPSADVSAFSAALHKRYKASGLSHRDWLARERELHKERMREIHKFRPDAVCRCDERSQAAA